MYTVDCGVYSVKLQIAIVNLFFCRFLKNDKMTIGFLQSMETTIQSTVYILYSTFLKKKKKNT